MSGPLLDPTSDFYTLNVDTTTTSIRGTASRQWQFVGEATGLGGVTKETTAPTAETYCRYLNKNLNGISVSTDGALSSNFTTSASIFGVFAALPCWF